ISTDQSEANGTLVAVRDSGPGIDPKHRELVFEAFYTTKSGGMGMGLSICRSIIAAHGGRLWAVANEPRGVLVQFTLPSVELRNGLLDAEWDRACAGRERRTSDIGPNRRCKGRR